MAASLRIYSRGISSPNLPTYSSGLPRGGHPTSLPIPLRVWRRIDRLSGKDAEPCRRLYISGQNKSSRIESNRPEPTAHTVVVALADTHRQPPRLGLPRVLGRSTRTTAVKRVCRFYFPLIHIVFSDPLWRDRGSLAYWEGGGLNIALGGTVRGPRSAGSCVPYQPTATRYGTFTTLYRELKACTIPNTAYSFKV